MLADLEPAETKASLTIKAQTEHLRGPPDSPGRKTQIFFASKSAKTVWTSHFLLIKVITRYEGP